MRTRQYDQILIDLDAGERAGIARKLFAIFQDHPEGATRQQLVYLIFNRPAKANLANDTGDRKIRDTIASMRAHLIPIVSTSGGAGYRFDDSPDARRAMLLEMVSRRDRLNEQIKAASMVWNIPAAYSEPETAVQGRLI